MAADNSWRSEALRAAAGPVICAVVLIGLLAAWTATGGAGTITRARLAITLAAVPMRGFSPQADARTRVAYTYLVIRNLGSSPDELVAVRSPVAGRVELTARGGPAATPTVVTGLTVPADGTLTLSPLGDDVVLQDPAPYESRASVPLTLVFRRAGQVTIDAPVTAPGTP
jgi:copper(I)-binding protein